jgi:hypothetical protein
MGRTAALLRSAGGQQTAAELLQSFGQQIAVQQGSKASDHGANRSRASAELRTAELLLSFGQQSLTSMAVRKAAEFVSCPKKKKEESKS